MIMSSGAIYNVQWSQLLLNETLALLNMQHAYWSAYKSDNNSVVQIQVIVESRAI